MAFSRPVLDAVQLFLRASSFEEATDVLRSRASDLLTEETSQIAERIAQSFASEGDEYGAARCRRAAQIFNRCREHGLDAGLIALKQEAIEHLAAAFVDARGVEEWTEIATNYFDHIIGDALTQCLKAWLEKATTPRNAYILRHRLRMIDRMKQHGLEGAVLRERRAELLRNVSNTRTPEDAAAMVEQHFDEFCTDEMGEVFADAVEETRDDAGLVRKLHRIRSMAIETAQTRLRRKPAARPAWLRPGDELRAMVELLKNEPFDRLRERVLTELDKNPALHGAFPEIIDALEGAAKLRSPKPSVDERPTQYRQLIEAVANVQKRPGEIEGLFGEIDESFGAPASYASVNHDSRLAIIEPWIVDLELSPACFDVVRSLPTDLPFIEAELQRSLEELAAAKARRDARSWSRCQREIALLQLLGAMRGDLQGPPDATRRCESAAITHARRDDPKAWANTHALCGETALAMLDRGGAGILEHNLRPIESSLVGRLENAAIAHHARKDAADRAIGHFELALDVYAHSRHEEQWAAALVGLATGLVFRWRGDRAANLREAERCFAKAMALAPREQSPHLWAGMLARYSSCLEHHDELTIELREKIYSSLSAAATVWTSQRYPERHRVLAEHRARVAFLTRDWDTALEAAAQVGTAAARGAQAALSDVEYALETARSSHANYMRAYCFALLDRPCEALAARERGMAEAMTESAVIEVLDRLPQRSVLVAPIVSTHGTAVVFACGRERESPPVLVLDALTDERVSRWLTRLPRRNDAVETGWLRILAQWRERPGNAELLARASGRLTELMGELWSAAVGVIVEHIRRALPQSVDSIFWAVDRQLTALPVHAAGGPASNGDRQCLGDLFAVSYLSSLADLRPPAPRGQPRSLLTVSPLSDPPLSFADQECAAAQHCFSNGSHLGGSDATVSRVLQHIVSFSHVHLACHGSMNWEEIDRSHLQLSDGPLLLKKLAAHELHGVQLMTLSACETGFDDFKQAGLLAFRFQRSLIRAGARCVISALWPVSDVATMLLMQHFYEQYVRRGLRADLALASAQRWLRGLQRADVVKTLGAASPNADIIGDAEYPFAASLCWAAFTLVGTPG
jgi:hypothetical protein